MKHADESDVVRLMSLANDARLPLTEPQANVLVLYLYRIIEVNRHLNLTRIADVDSGIRLHLLDSLLAVLEVRSCAEGRLLDIGTGGGFPGVPLCVWSSRRGVLLDSIAKKAHAVNGVLAELALSSQIVALPSRAERHARERPGEYAVVTARAVSELPALVELASPLLMPGGRLIAYKGRPDLSEIEHGQQAAQIVGLREISCKETVLPGGDDHRTVITFEKVGPPAVKLPRREGLAQRRPLA